MIAAITFMSSLNSLHSAQSVASTPVTATPVTIAIVDYEIGNLHSVGKVLANLGVNGIITDNPDRLWQADGIILPGVGAFDPAMQLLNDRHLAQPLRDIAASGKPFLGICLGMQILFEGSDEGKESGLGIIPGWVRRFRSEPGLTIPHIGWNTLRLTQPSCGLWSHLSPEIWTYFVHSYYVDPQFPQVCSAEVTHGSQTVTAAIVQDNILATQFHPEKSSKSGLQMLKNYVEMVKFRVPA